MFPAMLHGSAALAPYCLKNCDQDGAWRIYLKGVWFGEGPGPAGGCAGPGVQQEGVQVQKEASHLQKKCSKVHEKHSGPKEMERGPKKCFPLHGGSK